MKPHVGTDFLCAQCLWAFVPNIVVFERLVWADNFNSLHSHAVRCLRNIFSPSVRAPLLIGLLMQAQPLPPRSLDANTAMGMWGNPARILPTRWCRHVPSWHGPSRENRDGMGKMMWGVLYNVFEKWYFTIFGRNCSSKNSWAPANWITHFTTWW